MVEDFDSWKALVISGANMSVKDNICAFTPLQSLIMRNQKLVLRDLLNEKMVPNVPKDPESAASLKPLLLEHGLLGKNRTRLGKRFLKS